jgi:hypothetical protein
MKQFGGGDLGGMLGGGGGGGKKKMVKIKKWGLWLWEMLMPISGNGMIF